jgi:hypothetical protein
MKRNLMVFLVIVLPAAAQTIPEQTPSLYHSRDEYQLAHAMFAKTFTDLRQAQTNFYPGNAGDNLRFEETRAKLRELEQNWDRGRFESRQMGSAISAVQMVLQDNRLTSNDGGALYEDLSRLLDFQTEYY